MSSSDTETMIEPVSNCGERGEQMPDRDTEKHPEKGKDQVTVNFVQGTEFRQGTWETYVKQKLRVTELASDLWSPNDGIELEASIVQGVKDMRGHYYYRATISDKKTGKVFYTSDNEKSHSREKVLTALVAEMSTASKKGKSEISKGTIRKMHRIEVKPGMGLIRHRGNNGQSKE